MPDNAMTGNDAPDPNLVGNTALQPDVSNTYGAVAPQQPPQAQNPMAQNPGQANPMTQHHAMLGSALKNIAQTLEGQTTSAIPDPITGEIKEIPVQRKPGAFFRDLLLGAAMGGAASAALPKGSGAIAGLTTGYAAQSQNQERLQQQQKEEAFGKAQRAKAQNDQQAAKLEAQRSANALAQQTVAAHTHGMLVQTSNDGMNTPDQLSSYSDASSTLLNKLGGRAIGVDLTANGKNVNGVRGNGKQLFDMIQKDPKIMQSPQPDLFHRVDLLTYDKAAMAKDGVKQVDSRWVDKDGKSVNVEDYATHNIRDVPNSVWGEQLDMTNKDWNTISRGKMMSGDDGSVSHGTFGQAFATNTRANQTANNDLAAKHAPPENQNQALQWQSLYDDLRRRAANGEKIDPDEMEDAKDKAERANIFTKNANTADAAKEQNKAENKREPFPEFKQPEDAAGFAGQAAQKIKNNPNASDAQKAEWQSQIKYGTDMEKTLRNSIASTASVRTKAEDNARKDPAPDPSMVGPKGLLPQDQKRFAELPDNIQRQLVGHESSEISGLFMMADGDMSETEYSQNVRNKTKGLHRSEAAGLAHDINPYWTADLAKIKTNLKAQYTSTKPTDTGGKLFAFNNFMQHANELADVAQQWKDKRSSTGVPLVNMALKDLRKELKGDPLLTQLEAAMTAPTKEYMNVLNQGHAEQGLDRQKMDEVFNENSSPLQIVKGLQKYVGVAVDQLDGLDQPWRTVTGGTYPNLISPAAKQAAGKFGFAQKVAGYGSGGRLTKESMNQTPKPDQNALTHLYTTKGGEKVGWDPAKKTWVNRKTFETAKEWKNGKWE